ncbi:hypothetical protein BC829DRAFT_494026 [Chytridium lagenaria]|nr:hypothetical protein BC829DRAFT_494026 [Chytridium lagenaria]
MEVVSAEGSGYGVAVTRERVGMVEERVLVKDLLEEAVGEIKDVEKMVNVAGKVLKGLRVEALGIEGVTFVIDGVEPRAADDNAILPTPPVVKVRVDSSSRASLDLKDLHHLPVDGCTVLPYQLLNVPHNPIVALEAGDLLGYELATMINLEEDGEDEKEGEKEGRRRKLGSKGWSGKVERSGG